MKLSQKVYLIDESEQTLDSLYREFYYETKWITMSLSGREFQIYLHKDDRKNHSQKEFTDLLKKFESKLKEKHLRLIKIHSIED